LKLSELLGRPQIETVVDGAYIQDRRVLVTGAGGSIGSELCRQLVALNPAAIYMLDRDESSLHALQLSMTGQASLADPHLILADIRDHLRIVKVAKETRPEVIFHAAALKHQPLLELNPAEAVKTNVLGTANVLSAFLLFGADTFVNISTDKAATAQCVLGQTKRIAERLTAGYAPEFRCLSVRFGNVLGSRGSALDTFTDQLRDGRPVTITHPSVTRYLMTVQEAVALVLHSGAIGSSGQALVLDMGAPVAIVDLVGRLAAQLGVAPHIVYTGLRPGEQLHERRLSDTEPDLRPVHPLISHVTVPPLRQLCYTNRSVVETMDGTAVRSWIAHYLQETPE